MPMKIKDLMSWNKVRNVEKKILKGDLQ